MGRPSVFWPPLYPLVLAGIYLLLGYQPVAARLVQAVLGAVLPLAVFRAGHELGETKLARWASAGAAVYPYSIYFGAWLIAESLYFALSGVMLWSMVRLQHKPTYRQALVLGVIVGLAALAKPTALMQLPFLAIWFLISIRAPAVSKRLALGATTALCLVLVLAPWSIRNYVRLGRPVLISTNGGYTFYGANNPNAFGGHYENFPPRLVEMNEADEQSEFFRQGLAWIQGHPRQFLSLVVQKFRRLLSPLSVASSPQDMSLPVSWALYLAYDLFLLVCLYGLVLSLRRWRQFLVLYIPLLAVMTSTLLFYGDVRYTLPAVPSLLFLCALGAQAIGARRFRPLPGVALG